MNRRNRKKLLEEINNAFIDFMRDYRGTRFIKYFKSINNELIDRQGLVDNRELRRIIETHTEDVDFEDVAIFSLLLGAITSLIEGANQRQNRESAAIIGGLVTVYSLSDPKRFVSNVHKSLKNPQSVNNKKVHSMLVEYQERNTRALERIKSTQKSNLIRSQMKSKTREAKYINSKMKQWQSEGKPLEMQRHWAKRDVNANKKMMRALDTEIHANLEVGKLEQAKADGFTHKTWRTQGDDRVRSTRWHNWVADKRIPIEDSFELGNMKAIAPGDVSLPPSDRINCRCYLVYT